ncbi:unnamed protein product, partial [Dicrocoelium dendriticum]
LTTCEIPGFEVRMNTVCGDSSEEHDDDNSSHESGVKSNCGNRCRSPDDDHPCNGGIGSTNSEDDPEKPAEETGPVSGWPLKYGWYELARGECLFGPTRTKRSWITCTSAIDNAKGIGNSSTS